MPVVFPCLFIAASLAFAGPDVSGLEASLDAHRSAMDTHAVYPLTFTTEELRKASRGEVVKRRERLKGVDRVLGLVWTPASMDEVWAAMQDSEHWDYVDGFLEEHLPSSTFQNKVVYQRILFPWPFADRQWVIAVKNNPSLSAATDGRVWERTWGLSPERGAKNTLEKAIWVDVNDGGWLVADVGEGTLLSYHVRTVIGGRVPDEVVVRYSMGTLGSLLGGLSARAQQIPAHYGEAHTPIRRPDGSPIAPMAVESP